jgi:hypothetical protein
VNFVVRGSRCMGPAATVTKITKTMKITKENTKPFFELLVIAPLIP